ncbi:MAG: hypothetical protein CL455_07365 [Acidimicrobiaceae bacterium]|nr:hypothetical protein [Acidimicrobiaceae bacterium]
MKSPHGRVIGVRRVKRFTEEPVLSRKNTSSILRSTCQWFGKNLRFLVTGVHQIDLVEALEISPLLSYQKGCYLDEMGENKNQLLQITLNEDPDVWESVGFRVSQLENGDSFFTLGSVRFLFVTSDEPKGFSSMGALGLGEPIDSLPFKAIEPADMEQLLSLSAETHPNAISRIDHVVVTTSDCDRSTSAFHNAGIQSQRIRTFGEQKNLVRQTFFWLGNVILELVGPDTRSGDDPAIFWGLAFVSSDIKKTLSTLGDSCTPLKEAVQTGRRITTLKTRDIGISIPIAIMTPHL